MDKAKVLITGPVNGDFDSLKSKLSSLQKSKAGPFDICFSVGPFFHAENDDDDLESCQKNKEFFKGWFAVTFILL